MLCSTRYHPVTSPLSLGNVHTKYQAHLFSQSIFITPLKLMGSLPSYSTLQNPRAKLRTRYNPPHNYERPSNLKTPTEKLPQR